MRDIYYQPVGNPLQLDRLPATRPEIELPAPVATTGAQLRDTALAMSVVAAAGTTTLILYSPGGWSWLEPYDLIFAAAVATAVLTHCILSGQLHSLLHPASLAALVLMCVNHRTPWLMQVAAFSTVLGALVYSFGRHWAAVCTANTAPRPVLEAMRAQWEQQLVLLAVFAAALCAAVLWFDSAFLKTAVLTLPLAAAVLRRPAGLASVRSTVVFRSFLSWFAYEAQPLPGLLQSPAGSKVQRFALAFLTAILAAVVLDRWSGSPVPCLVEVSQQQMIVLARHWNTGGEEFFEQLRYRALVFTLAFIGVGSLPVVLPWCLVLSATMPVLLDAATKARHASSAPNLEAALADIRRSSDRTERQSIYLGRVVADGSPVLIPRSIFREHAHGLGDSGAGKTSLFLCPLIEQLAMTGDCSVIVLDLKADTLELLASLRSASETLQRERGIEVPLKWFSNQTGRTTFAFNPLLQPFWSELDLLTRTDILCGANGLSYGTDYGQGFYSSANAANLYQTLKTFPDVETFSELADCVGSIINTAKKRDLHPEIRKAGVHVHEVIKRLAACQPLNVSRSSSFGSEAIEQAIDLADVFRTPQLIYFHLSATLSPSGAPEIARLVNYMLLAAATQTERRHQVFLVIDEFQRMVASNLEYMLQLARSMGVGVILANQSMEDLRKSTTDLIPAIEANCRLRQWFAVSSSHDRDRLIRGSGSTIDYSFSRSESTNHEGKKSISYSESERVVERITLNDVLLTSDHPFRSILQIRRGAGYAQYGGMPVIIESSYHISSSEYRRRKALPWPEGKGAFTPGPHRQPEAKGQQQVSGPQWSEEVIEQQGEEMLPTTDSSIDELFNKFHQSQQNAPRRPRRRRKS